jgi:hypothetical protein
MSDQPEKLSVSERAGNDPANESVARSLAARYGRRALILGAAATGAGLAADLVAGGTADAAPDASSVLLGKLNFTHGSTVVSSKGGTGLSGRTVAKGEAGVSGFDNRPTGGAMGLYGKSIHGTGILGSSAHQNGIVGQARTVGFSGVAGLDFCPTKGAQGVYGQTFHGIGVFGIGLGGGNGVVGQSNTSGFSGVVGHDMAPSGGTAVFAQSHHGTAVVATSEFGTALQVDGKTKFSNSGVVNVPGGSKTATVKVDGITTSSKVFATIQKPQSGVSIEGAEAGNGSFTLTLSKSTSAPLPVAWFVLE